jgi:hypothetical protein
MEICFADCSNQSRSNRAEQGRAESKQQSNSGLLHPTQLKINMTHVKKEKPQVISQIKKVLQIKNSAAILSE